MLILLFYSLNKLLYFCASFNLSLQLYTNLILYLIFLKIYLFFDCLFTATIIIIEYIKQNSPIIIKKHPNQIDEIGNESTNFITEVTSNIPNKQLKKAKPRRMQLKTLSIVDSFLFYIILAPLII